MRRHWLRLIVVATCLALDARVVLVQERALPGESEMSVLAPTAWDQKRTGVLISLTVTTAALLLVTWLLGERRRRITAHVAMSEQLAYRRLISELTDDLAFHESSTTAPSLERALGRIGRHVGADGVALTARAASRLQAPARLAWLREERGGNGSPPTSVLPHAPNADLGTGAHVAFPLFASGVDVGTLELYSFTQQAPWPGRFAPDVQAAAEILASGLAGARAARAVRRTEELNQVMLASWSTQLAILDRHGVIVLANDAWREVADRGGVGASRDAFVGTSYLEECRRAAQRGVAEADVVLRGIEAVLAGRSQIFRLEHHSPAPAERWYELVVDRLEREEGGAVVMHLDITAHRLADRRAEEGRRQVEHMGRVATIGELAAGLSHELRQPLSAIRSNAQAGIRFLKSEGPSTGELKAILDDIVADDVRAATVIDRIRALLRKDQPTSQLVDLNEVCQSVGMLLRADVALRDARLELDLDAALPPVRGDPIELQQVLLNLVLNALEATTSSARRREVAIRTIFSGGQVTLCVRDSGRGLSPEVERHLFESFFSTKEHGLGMGLAIVRSIVERHRGEIRAENSTDAGAIFYVTLPAARPSAPFAVLPEARPGVLISPA